MSNLDYILTTDVIPLYTSTEQQQPANIRKGQ